MNSSHEESSKPKNTSVEIQHSIRTAAKISGKVKVMRYSGLPDISGVVVDTSRNGDIILSETRRQGKYMGLVYVKNTSIRRVQIVE